MLRLTVLLCAGMFAALLIGGEDRGQLRPGLALAKAEGRLNLAPAPPPEVLPVVAVQPAPKIAPRVTQVLKPAAPRPAVVPAAATPRSVAQPVFTLSGQTAAPLPEPEIDRQATPPTLSEGQVWYVTAKSVNVRQGPSTEAAVLGKLGQGEAATVMWQEGDDWARIIIEGDGLEGYVATRFLSNTAP
ncbi:MAG: SH3 domain-containing protein [Pseudomonadota bacterium]